MRGLLTLSEQQLQVSAGHLDVAKKHLEVDEEYHQQVLDRLPDQEKECL